MSFLEEGCFRGEEGRAFCLEGDGGPTVEVVRFGVVVVVELAVDGCSGLMLFSGLGRTRLWRRATGAAAVVVDSDDEDWGRDSCCRCGRDTGVFAGGLMLRWTGRLVSSFCGRAMPEGRTSSRTGRRLLFGRLGAFSLLTAAVELAVAVVVRPTVGGFRRGELSANEIIHGMRGWTQGDLLTGEAKKEGCYYIKVGYTEETTSRLINKLGPLTCLRTETVRVGIGMMDYLV